MASHEAGGIEQKEIDLQSLNSVECYILEQEKPLNDDSSLNDEINQQQPLHRLQHFLLSLILADEKHSKSPQPALPPAPIPFGILIVLLTMQLIDSMSFTCLFSYVSYMVGDLGITNDPSQYGYYVAIIASCYYIPQIFASYMWCFLSDKIGRRPILLWGSLIGSLLMLSFGFSYSFWFACLSRFLTGFLNANIGITKTVITDITDTTNRSIIFSYFTNTFLLASILGPLVGGGLARPHAQYPELVKLLPLWLQNFTKAFPYILPSIVISSLGIIASVIGFFKLPETNKYSWYYKKFIQKNIKEEQLPIIINNEKQNEREKIVEWWKKCGTSKIFFKKVIELWKQYSAPILSCFLYGFLGFKQIMFDECLPLLALLPVENGGFGFENYELGILGAILAFSVAIHNIIVFQKINLLSKINLLTCYRLSCIVDLVFTFIFPEVMWLAVDKSQPMWRIVIFWLVLLLITFVRQLTFYYSFPSAHLLINNTISKKNIGTWNGFAQSLVAFCRMIAPIVGGTIFASSISVNVFPFDYRFTFYVVALMNVLMFLTTLPIRYKETIKALEKEEEEKQINNSEENIEEIVDKL